MHAIDTPSDQTSTLGPEYCWPRKISGALQGEGLLGVREARGRAGTDRTHSSRETALTRHVRRREFSHVYQEGGRGDLIAREEGGRKRSPSLIKSEGARFTTHHERGR